VDAGHRGAGERREQRDAETGGDQRLHHKRFIRAVSDPRGKSGRGGGAGAVLALTRCLALDHAADGIRAVAICPGYVRTDLLGQFYDNKPDPEAARTSLTQKHPPGRICEPDEVASLATWLASDEAAFVSGQPYIIDGALTAGRTFGWADSPRR
jgi:hypothetical protein